MFDINSITEKLVISISRAFIIVLLIFIFALYFLPITLRYNHSEIFNLMALVFAILAVIISVNANMTTNAIAYLHYDEKITMIVKNKKCIINNNSWGKLEDCKNELISILNLKNYVNKRKKEELIGHIIDILHHSYNNRSSLTPDNIQIHNELIDKAKEMKIQEDLLSRYRII